MKERDSFGKLQNFYSHKRCYVYRETDKQITHGLKLLSDFNYWKVLTWEIQLVKQLEVVRIASVATLATQCPTSSKVPASFFHLPERKRKSAQHSLPEHWSAVLCSAFVGLKGSFRQVVLSFSLIFALALFRCCY